MTKKTDNLRKAILRDGKLTCPGGSGSTVIAHQRIVQTMLTDKYKGQVAWRDAAPELQSSGPRQRHGNKAESGAAASRIMEVASQESVEGFPMGSRSRRLGVGINIAIHGYTDTATA